MIQCLLCLVWITSPWARTATYLLFKTILVRQWFFFFFFGHSLFQWGKWGVENTHNLLQDSQLVSGQVGTCTQILLLQIPYFFYCIVMVKSEVKLLVTQSCLTLCNPMDYSLPGFSVHGDSPDKKLEWVAIPFSKRSAHPGMEPRSPALQADSLPGEPPGTVMVVTLKWCGQERGLDSIEQNLIRQKENYHKP